VEKFELLIDWNAKEAGADASKGGSCRFSTLSPLSPLPEVLRLPHAEACEGQKVSDLITAAFGDVWEINDAKQVGGSVEGTR
jgi:hypothetical protein